MGRLIAILLGGAALALYVPLLLPDQLSAVNELWQKLLTPDWYARVLQAGPRHLRRPRARPAGRARPRVRRPRSPEDRPALTRGAARHTRPAPAPQREGAANDDHEPRRPSGR